MRINDFFADDLAALWCPAQGLTQAGLRAQAQSVTGVLDAATSGIDHPPRVALACRSLVSFVPGLLGAWASGATVQLLPNAQPQTLRRAYERCDLFLHDVVDAKHFSAKDVYVPDVIGGAAATPETASQVADLAERASLIFSTSGTTGEAAQSHKSVAQLYAEVRVLAALLDDAKVLLSTVPGHHLYGLLFGVLAPLRRGTAIITQQAFLPSEVAGAIAAGGVDVLVSTPPHLAAMRGVAMPKGLRVFSSGAPLPMEVHVALMSAHRWQLTDVLGSTETGGIATRSAPMARWRALPGVVLSTDDEMTTVTSPWCDNGRHVLADRLELNADGSFAHLGRRDDVVKIGGKRVAISAVEALLRRLPGVSDAAVLYDARPGVEGRLKYAIAGELRDKPRVTAAVRREFDPVFAPRQIVFVDRLPRDAVGKLPRAALAAMFAKAPPADASNRGTAAAAAPSVPMSLQGDVVTCDIRRELPFFDGHFPMLPVLAGAVVLQYVVLPAVRLLAPSLGRVGALRRIRFVQPVFPGAQIQVTGVRRGDEFSFEATSVGNVVASGVIACVPTEEAP
ncbi:MAG: AMP-binding protein [Myxococcales bacterium]|nr:AMP-binding protein [Myxococcales bacterium]